MSRWQLNLVLHESSPSPIFVQIADAIVAEIQRGRLGKGARLPGSRALAQSLKVHRNTVLSAYAELQSQGWLETRQASGTFVATDLPSAHLPNTTPSNGSAPHHSLGFELRSVHKPSLSFKPPPGILGMTAGMPDLRLIPVDELARAYRRAVKMRGHALMGYTEPQGHVALRTALSAMLTKTRGLTPQPQNILITRGSQMGLYLTARALLGPGDVVAVEALGYPPAWDALRQTGARLVPISVDERGFDTGELEALLQREPVRAVYVTPHHQYPTMAVMAPERRAHLLALARTHRFAVIEDDYDNEFHYDGRPVLPLASADTHGVVLYLGTLSKALAPGLRLGYVVAPPEAIAALTALRTSIDRQGNQTIEAAVADLLEDGTVQRHARRMRRVYKTRRDALTDRLRARLGHVLSFEPPAGGMSLWATVHQDVDVDRWSAQGLKEKVFFSTGQRFDFHQRRLQTVRLGFACLTPEEIDTGTQRMLRALRACGHDGDL